MNKTNKYAIISIILASISLIISLSTCNFETTKYATIKGESFTIPKQEGVYYYER